MPRFARARWLVVPLLAALAGCAENSMVLKGQVDRIRQEQAALAKQREELQGRTAALDTNNAELQSMIAQMRQQNKALEDHVNVLREQLNSTTSQLTRLREEKKTADQKVQAMNASMQRQGSVSITPNNSLAQSLPAINLPDVRVRRDGDVVRVELPSHRLFEAGNARLLPGANQMIATAAKEILHNYPDNIIGVEGHTDPDPAVSPQWRNNHQLSIGRALAVYDVLLAQAKLQSSQAFVVGHGGNHPVFSNATPAGKLRNNRVELVVYPETVRKTP